MFTQVLVSITVLGKVLLQQVKHTLPRHMQTAPAHNTFTRHTPHLSRTSYRAPGALPLPSSALSSAHPDLLAT